MALCGLLPAQRCARGNRRAPESSSCYPRGPGHFLNAAAHGEDLQNCELTPTANLAYFVDHLVLPLTVFLSGF